MKGFDVVTVDDEKVGTVTGLLGEYLVVEHGLIRKSKRALPSQFANLDDEAHEVRITVGKEIFLNSPELEEELDEQAVLDYYGLAPSEGPGTEGYGVTDPGDPARSSEEQAMRDGVEPAQKQRARIRGGEPQFEESPGLLGDQFHGAEAQRRKED